MQPLFSAVRSNTCVLDRILLFHPTFCKKNARLQQIFCIFVPITQSLSPQSPILFLSPRSSHSPRRPARRESTGARGDAEAAQRRQRRLLRRNRSGRDSRWWCRNGAAHARLWIRWRPVLTGVRGSERGDGRITRKMRTCGRACEDRRSA
uniref:Uncharacterized protein n=1 Tax=Leersia perrieri TaxID=77586 RepID=A0A0D9WPL2_9ORYZ